MKLERKVRLCSAAAAVLIAAIALTGCGGSKSTASSAAASSVAASTAAATNNSCGEGVTWALADGTLTISGTGRMTNFTKDAPAPWADQADQITTVEVEGTVTSVGNKRLCGALCDHWVLQKGTIITLTSPGIGSTG